MAEEEPLGAEREPTWDQKVIKLNEVLAERSIPYAFGGAIALNYHREPRSTLLYQCLARQVSARR